MDEQSNAASFGEMSLAALEDVLMEAWAACLGTGRFTLHDDFLDLGGNSIAAMQIAATINARLGAEVLHRDVIECGSIRRLAQHIRTNVPVRPRDAESVAVPAGRLVATYAQKCWWTLRDGERTDASNIVVHSFRIKGVLAPIPLQKSLVSIVARHDGLRMMFEEQEGQLFMQSAEAWQCEDLARNDLRSGTLCESQIREEVARMTRTSVDLCSGPVFRAGLWRVAADDHLLIFAWHHIVFDDQSDRIFFKELQLCYAAHAKNAAPELLPVQSYANLAAREQTSYATEKYRKQLQFWHEKLADAANPSPWWASLLSSREDKRVALVKSEATLSGEWLTALRHLGTELRLSLSVIMLAAWQFTFHLVFRPRSVVTTLLLSQRFTAEQQNVIGLQVALLPIVSTVDECAAVRAFLQQVSAELAQASRNGDVNVRALKDIYGAGPWMQTGRILYNYVEKEEEEWLRLDGLRVERYEWRPERHYPIKPDSFLMGFGVLKRRDSISLGLSTLLPQVSRESMDFLIALYRDVLDGFVKQPDAALGDLSRQGGLSEAAAGISARISAEVAR